MQATITYLLSEQAQRAQMAATGQPVARKQVQLLDVVEKDLDLLDIDENGNPYLDITRKIGELRGNSRAAAMAIAGLDSVQAAWHDTAEVNHPDTNLLALVLLGQAARATRERAEKEKKERAEAEAKAKRVAKTEEYRPLIEAFLNDPNALAEQYYAYGSRDSTITVNGVKMSASVADGVYEAAQEAERRDTARKKAAESAKAEAEAAKEKAKRGYLSAFLREHGTESQIERDQMDLLPREEGITALADFTFARLAAFARYTKESRPVPDCSDEHCEECEINHTVEDEADSLTDAEWQSYRKIEDALDDPRTDHLDVPGRPTHLVEMVLRTHRSVHDCSHNDGCKPAENHGVMVKIKAGPFVLQREYEL